MSMVLNKEMYYLVHVNDFCNKSYREQYQTIQQQYGQNHKEINHKEIKSKKIINVRALISPLKP